MPIYEYACRKCGHRFEHLARTLSSPAPECPSCGAASPEKQLSVFSATQSLPSACPAEAGSAPSCQGGSCATRGCPLSG